MSADSIPQFLYGTAWKEDETRRLTLLAIESGFRGIDTANQRKHYFEAAVGEGIRDAIERGIVTREELFLQTKFTFQRGQDHRLPYDPKATIATQVEQSFAKSLEHLGVATIDSYVLHGPTLANGLVDADWEAWRAMEAIHDRGLTRFLGISNVNLGQIEQLWRDCRVKPTFVQNRCYASRGWDRDIRQFCRPNGIVYQGFSLLTANRDAIADLRVRAMAKKHGRTPAQIIFRFAIQSKMLPLTGTTDERHMHEDLSVSEFELSGDEVEQMERISA